MRAVATQKKKRGGGKHLLQDRQAEAAGGDRKKGQEKIKKIKKKYLLRDREAEASSGEADHALWHRDACRCHAAHQLQTRWLLHSLYIHMIDTRTERDTDTDRHIDPLAASLPVYTCD